MKSIKAKIQLSMLSVVLIGSILNWSFYSLAERQRYR